MKPERETPRARQFLENLAASGRYHFDSVDARAAFGPCRSSLLIRTGLPARTAVEHLLESVVGARGKLADELLGDQPSNASDQC